MKKIKFASVSFLIVAATQLSAISVSNFGSSTYTILGGSFDTTGQTANTLPLTGNDGNDFFGDFATGPKDLSSFIGSVDLTVSGTTVDSPGTGTTGTPSSTFDIVFIDNSGSFREAKYVGGTWVGLRDSSTTTLTFSSSDPGFDASNVLGFDLVGNGFGDAVDATLTDLSLVPEPSAFALIAGCFGLAWMTVRRRV